MKKEDIAKKMIPDEKQGIKEYSKLEKESKGSSKKVIKKILPQEKHHLRELTNI
jgi:rubrerythrin